MKNRIKIVKGLLETVGLFEFDGNTMWSFAGDVVHFYDLKIAFKEILDKEVTLRHMMKPNTKTELYKMVQDAGFEIHTFWQNFNFVGIVALKK